MKERHFDPNLNWYRQKLYVKRETCVRLHDINSLYQARIIGIIVIQYKVRIEFLVFGIIMK